MALSLRTPVIEVSTQNTGGSELVPCIWGCKWDLCPQDIKVGDLITRFLRSFTKSEWQGTGRQNKLGVRDTPRLRAVIWLVEECSWRVRSSPKRCRRSSALALGSCSRSLKTERHSFQRPVVSLRRSGQRDGNGVLLCMFHVEIYLRKALPELVPWDSCHMIWGWVNYLYLI